MKKKRDTLLFSDRYENHNLLASDHWGARIVNDKVEVYAKDGEIIRTKQIEPQWKATTPIAPPVIPTIDEKIKLESLRIVTELANKPKRKAPKFRKEDGYGGLESAYLQWLLLNEE